MFKRKTVEDIMESWYSHLDELCAHKDESFALREKYAAKAKEQQEIADKHHEQGVKASRIAEKFMSILA